MSSRTLQILILVSIIFANIGVGSAAENQTPANGSNISTAQNQTLNNTLIDYNVTGNATWWDDITETFKTGERSQNRVIYGGIFLILVLQATILVFVIRCKRRRTFTLKRK